MQLQGSARARLKESLVLKPPNTAALVPPKVAAANSLRPQGMLVALPPLTKAASLRQAPLAMSYVQK